MATTPAKAPEETTTSVTAAPKAKAPEAHVRYIGPASRRILTEEDWTNVGAKGQKEVEWNFQNEFRVPVSKFSENALDYLEMTDDRFIVVGG